MWLSNSNSSVECIIVDETRQKIRRVCYVIKTHSWQKMYTGLQSLNQLIYIINVYFCIKA